MAKTIKGADLSAILEQELTQYKKAITEKINHLSERTAKAIVTHTRATAPKMTGDYRNRIAYKQSKRSPGGDTYVWYVKPPDHRLTHLLVHGYAKQNGGRTKADPFLANALDVEFPKFLRDVKEAVKDG